MRAAIVLTSTRVHPFEPDEKQFLQAIAREIALALENARLYGATMEVNQELRKEIEERKRAERTLADFTAMVAHDLRSPLSNVISIAASLSDGLFGSVNEPQQKWLWKIQENCNSLVSHVSDFLDISKIDAGRLEVVREPVDVLRLLHDGLSEYSVEAERRKITIKSAITEGLPRLFLDRRRIHQVLENLLSNAIKFTGSGGEIEVGARAWDGSAAVLWVKDTGIGIPLDELELIFDKYHQVTRQQQASQMGTGLGLAICKKIIEAHGGRIWAESEMGKGTTIFLLLPADIATHRLEA
jgi:signal transduction histidine kinase